MASKGDDEELWLQAWEEVVSGPTPPDTESQNGSVDAESPWLTAEEELAHEREEALRVELEREARLPDPAIVMQSTTRSAAGYIPVSVSRKQRREMRRQAQRRLQEHHQVERRERARAKQQTRAERKAGQYLPPRGEAGSRQLRPLWKLRLKPHHATSDKLAYAYAFLAHSGIGAQGALIGPDVWSGTAFPFDVWNLYQRRMITNPNMVVAGVIGSGKSALMKGLAVRQIAFGRKVFVPSDPKGEWTPVAEKVGGGTISLGRGLSVRLNPLDEGPRPKFDVDQHGKRVPMTDEQWAIVVHSRRLALVSTLTAQALGRDLRSPERKALSTALRSIEKEEETPLLPHLVRRMLSPVEDVRGSTLAQLREEGREAALALDEVIDGGLAGLFDGPSTTKFDPSLPMLTIDLHRLGRKDPATPLAVTCASAWMEAALADPDGGQRLVVYDEGWEGMANNVSLARMQSNWKLARFFGISNALVLHRLSDLDAVGAAGSSERELALGLLADTSTRVMMRQEADQMKLAVSRLGLTATEAAVIPDLGVGEGLWKLGDLAAVVYETLTPEELRVYDTDSRMNG